MSSIAKILVVDDNPKYVSDILPMYGYEIEVAVDGIKALNILNKDSQNFDMVLLDVMMPNMDGWQTLKAIRNNDKIKNIPIIMLTAVDNEQKQISGLKCGADDYIVKPFTIPNLLARVEALLRRSAWQTEKNKSQSISLALNSQDPIQPLTNREKEVLKLVAQGSNNNEIAEKLFVREVTVKTHLNSVFKKLNVSNRTQAVLLAMQMNLLD